MTGEGADIVVIGGGPAGAAAAVILARSGRDVLVLERAHQPGHKVCGEFLSSEVVAALDRLDLDPFALGAAPIEEVRLTAAGAVAASPLPFRAAGLSRPVLDAALLHGAAAAGARVRRGQIVRAIVPAAKGVALRLGDGTVLGARTAILATGKTDLKGHRRPTTWRGRGAMLGLKMHFRLPPRQARRLGRSIELHLFRGGCAGLQPVDGMANLCITLSRELYACSGNDFPALLHHIGCENPAFAAALQEADPAWDAPLAIARVPYGYCRPADSGNALPVWHVGDQAAVTASFTGDGLAMALASGIAAGEHILAGGERETFHRRFAARAGRQLRPAMALQALLDRPVLHRAAVAAARWQPRLLRQAALWTRLPAPLEQARAA